MLITEMGTLTLAPIAVATIPTSTTTTSKASTSSNKKFGRTSLTTVAASTVRILTNTQVHTRDVGAIIKRLLTTSISMQMALKLGINTSILMPSMKHRLAKTDIFAPKSIAIPPNIRTLMSTLTRTIRVMNSLSVIAIPRAIIGANMITPTTLPMDVRDGKYTPTLTVQMISPVRMMHIPHRIIKR